MKTTKSIPHSPNGGQTVRRILSAAFIAALCASGLTAPTYAATLQNSQIYTGTLNLLNDLMSWAMILCPIIGGLAAIVFLIRRGMSDDQEGKGWMKRVYWAIGAGVGGGLVTGLIALITSYYT